MPIRRLCLCFSALLDEEDVTVAAYSTPGAAKPLRTIRNGLPTPPAADSSAARHEPNGAPMKAHNTDLADTVRFSAVLQAQPDCNAVARIQKTEPVPGKTATPRPSYERSSGNPSLCDPSSQLQLFSSELQNMPSHSNAAVGSLPASASLPVSLEVPGNPTRTLKAKYCSGVGTGLNAYQTNFTLRAMSQLVGAEHRIGLFASRSSSAYPESEAAETVTDLPQPQPARTLHPPVAPLPLSIQVNAVVSSQQAPKPEVTAAAAHAPTVADTDGGGGAIGARTAPSWSPAAHKQVVSGVQPQQGAAQGDPTAAASPTDNTTTTSTAAATTATATRRKPTVSHLVRVVRLARNLSLSRRTAPSRNAAAPTASRSSCEVENGGESATSPFTGMAAPAASSSGVGETPSTASVVAPAPAAAAVGGCVSSVFSTNAAIAGSSSVSTSDDVPAHPDSVVTPHSDPAAARESGPEAGAAMRRPGWSVSAGGVEDDATAGKPTFALPDVADVTIGAPPAPAYGGSAPLMRIYEKQVKLPYQASRHMSQVAFLHMLQGAGGPAGGGAPDPLALSPLHPQHLATLNLAALSREITCLRWIGQGGGGAVFQGVWQGAPVAVKFMFSEVDPESPGGGVDAVALEGVLSSVVSHPNVVHTFAFQCTRLTEESFAEYGEYGRQDSHLDDHGHPDILGSLLDTGGLYGNSSSGAARRAGGGVAGPSRLGTALIQQQPLSDGDSDSDGDDAAGGRCANVDVVAAACAQQQQQQRDRAPAAAGGGGGGGGAGVAQFPGHVPTSVLELTFQSEEGFGDPDLTAAGRGGWTVRQVLAHLKARPGMYMTHIIMEHCDRGSLLSAIKRGVFRMEDGGAAAAAGPPAGAAGAGMAARFPRRIVLRALLRTARDVAQGMCHLHGNGIIHGDLKPGNVLLRGCRSDRRGFVATVADFGLSKVSLGDKPLEAHHWSTVTVMAPEVILGRWLKASDVFSFGILLWQLVTSEPVPYSKLTVPQILMGVSQGTLKPDWPSSAHPALVRLGRACLATAPEKRPSFEAIVKVLIKIEKHVRDELRLHKALQVPGAAASTAPLRGVPGVA